MSIRVTIGERAQSYVVLDGCGRCLVGDCAIGCHAQLFRRLIIASLPGGQLIPVAQPQGLAVRPYTQAALCWPSKGARPMTAALLAPWAEARLMLHWSWRRGPTVAGVLMATGEASLGQAMVAKGWRSAALPAVGVQWLRRQRLPPALPGARWGGQCLSCEKAFRGVRPGREAADW
jgi:hypothetical protein